MTRKVEAYWVESQKRWQCKVQEDGARKTFYSSTPGKKGKIEAERKADNWLESNLISQNSRVSMLLDDWLKGVKKSASHAHWRQYDGYKRNWISPAIGRKRVGKLTEQDLQDVITTAYQGGLSRKTLSNIKTCMSTFIKYCRKKKVTTLRPENLTIPFGAKKSKKTILQPSDLQILFASDFTTYRGKVVKDWFINAYRFAAIMGLRPGELIAAKTKNINKNRMSTTESINNDNELTTGKNDNAQRTYILPTLAQDILDEQRKMLKEAGVISPYIFPRRDGDFVRQTAFERALTRYCKHNNLPSITPYELRHTFVSVNKDMPDALLKSVVGHSKNMDTQGTYGHEVQGDMQRVADYIDSAYTSLGINPKK